MTIDMTKAYCDGFQTTEGTADGWGKDSVNTMVKHFPGGGPCEGGRDAHYAYGKYAVYPGENFAEHLRPFTEGAFSLGGKTKKQALSCLTTRFLMREIRNTERMQEILSTNI